LHWLQLSITDFANEGFHDSQHNRLHDRHVLYAGRSHTIHNDRDFDAFEAHLGLASAAPARVCIALMPWRNRLVNLIPTPIWTANATRANLPKFLSEPPRQEWALYSLSASARVLPRCIAHSTSAASSNGQPDMPRLYASAGIYLITLTKPTRQPAKLDRPPRRAGSDRLRRDRPRLLSRGSPHEVQKRVFVQQWRSPLPESAQSSSTAGQKTRTRLLGTTRCPSSHDTGDRPASEASPLFLRRLGHRSEPWTGLPVQLCRKFDLPKPSRSGGNVAATFHWTACWLRTTRHFWLPCPIAQAERAGVVAHTAEFSQDSRRYPEELARVTTKTSNGCFGLTSNV